jgi:hypothetical protein
LKGERKMKRETKRTGESMSDIMKKKTSSARYEPTTSGPLHHDVVSTSTTVLLIVQGPILFIMNSF